MILLLIELLSRQQVREALEAVRLQHKQHACWSTK